MPSGIYPGNKGHITSLETRKKLSNFFKKNPVRYWLGKKRSEETRKKMSEAKKGKKRSEETKEKMSKAHLGKKQSQETIRKRIKTRRESDWWKNPGEISKKMKEVMKGRKISKEWRRNMIKAHKKVFERILQEIPILEKQGFRCIPITKVIPDIIGIKDNKVYAIEVEYNKRGKSVSPRYSKYTPEIKKYFDDVIWIIRKR